MHKFIENYWALILVVLIGLTPLLWFTPDNIITGTDLDFTPYPQDRLEHRSYLWDGNILGGTDRSNNIASLVYIAPNALLDMLGFEIETNQKIGFVLWFELIGLSMYLLMSIIFNKNKEQLYAQNVGKFSASALYMLGFYNMFLWVRLQLSVTTLIMVPLYIGILIAMQKGVLKLKTAISLIVFLGFLSAPTGLQPPLLYIFFLFIFFYLFFSIFANRPVVFVLKTKELIRVWFLIGLFFIIGSLFWLVPLVSYVLSSGYANPEIGKETYEVYSLLKWVSEPLSMDNIFRFYGDVIWHDSWAGELYYPEFEAYLNSKLLILFSFVIPVLAFLSFILMRKTEYWFFVVFFGLIAVSTLFLSKGVHEPFGQIYLWLVDNVPMFWIQRAPWQKFALFTSFSYSVLFGLSVYYLSLRVRIKNSKSFLNFVKRNKLPIGVPLTLLVFLLGFHYIFTLGKMFPTGSGEKGFHQVNGLGMQHSYPEYLDLSRNFINSHKQEFKILLLPDEKTSIYDWGYAGAALPSIQLFKKGVVFKQYGEGFAPPNSIDAMQSRAIELLHNDESIEFARLLGRMNVKYILQRNDFRYDFFGDYDSPVFIKDRLDRQPGISLYKSIGKWDFYKINDNLFKPLIGLNEHIEGGSKERLVDYANIDNMQIRHINKLKLPTNTHNNIKFNRLNNSAIVIQVKDIKGYYSLDFLENFDRNWKAHVIPVNKRSNLEGLIEFEMENNRNPLWLRNSITIKNSLHYKSNNFANSWLVDTYDLCEKKKYCLKKANNKYDLLIVVEFLPQRLFHWAALISGFFYLLSFFYLVFLLLNRINKNEIKN